MKRQSPLTLGERLEVESVLEAAFAPLRERHTDLSPLRVRAAVRWGRGLDRPAAPAVLGWSGPLRRLSELSVAVGMSVLLFGAVLSPAEPVDTLVTADAAAVAYMVVADQEQVAAIRQERATARRIRLIVLRLDRSGPPLQEHLDPTAVQPRLAPVVTRPDLEPAAPY